MELIFFIIFLLLVVILSNIVYFIMDISNYKRKVKSIKEVREFSYATYDDFLNEFNKHKMYNNSKAFGFYNVIYKEDFTEIKNQCIERQDIIFDNIYMILSYKDYIKANKFIKKELEKIKEEKTEINNLHKWDKN